MPTPAAPLDSECHVALDALAVPVAQAEIVLRVRVVLHRRQLVPVLAWSGKTGLVTSLRLLARRQGDGIGRRTKRRLLFFCQDVPLDCLFKRALDSFTALVTKRDVVLRLGLTARPGKHPLSLGTPPAC